MSRYDWEEGSIKIPQKAYAAFRNGFIAKLRARQEEEFLVAKRVVDAVRAAPAAQRGHEDGLQDKLRDALGSRGEPALDIWRIAFEVFHDPLQTDASAGSPKPRKERKTPRALTKAIASLAQGKDRSFQGIDCSVTFNDKNKTVTWCVQENNHAVESARASFLGKTLFTMLSGIQWTRGSGGEIVGNDEYNRESSMDGGAANYVTQRFGPKAQEKPLKPSALRPSQARDQRRYIINFR